MRPHDRTVARRQLDKRLAKLANLDVSARPQQGWVRAIRQALGMTTGQFAKRLGVKQPRTLALEKAEANGAITMDSLARAADALDCRLVYALVPRTSLERLVEERAALLAKKRLQTTRHTMMLEDQAVAPADEAAQLENMIRDLVAQSGSKLWDDD